MNTWRDQSEWRYPYICVDCRLVRSLHYTGEHAPEAAPRCPRCNRPLWCAGNAFKAPRRTNATQWKKLAVLIAAGHRGFWRHHGEHRLGTDVRTLGQANAYARQKRRPSSRTPH